MRKLKFRAWDEGKKVMHNDFQYIETGNEGNDWAIFLSDKQGLESDWRENPHFSQQLKKMQAVGISDKEGTEIFEGDIVEFGGLGIVRYDEDRFYVDCGTSRTRVSRLAKVVGNIYQNPDLLPVANA